MKAYNTPNDTLTIKSDEGEELVSITPEGASIKNLDGSSFGFTAEDAGKILVVDSEGNLVPQETFTIEITLNEGTGAFETTTTPLEVDAAVRAGKKILISWMSYIFEPPVGQLTVDGTPLWVPLSLCCEADDASSLAVLTLWFTDVNAGFTATLRNISFDN